MEHAPVLTQLRQVVVYTPTDDGVPNGALIAAVVLRFAEADLLVEANPDNDEAVLRVDQRVELMHWGPEDAAPRDVTTEPHWSALVGADAPWRWQLTNQQGYRDGVQVEFSHGEATTQRQWLAAASHLHEATVLLGR